MRLRFEKWSGAGNDFVLVEGPLRGAPAALARRLCDRRRGVGADGLLVAARGRGEVRLGYWNADGSPAFCGNGSRCAALWAASKGLARGGRVVLRTRGGRLEARVTGRGRAEVRMPAPDGLRRGLKLKALGRTWSVDFVVVGVPHAVVFVPDAAKAPLETLGPVLRRHPAFGKAGANVNFVEVRRNGLAMRTFERGVEGETLACGSGVVAAAYCALKAGKVRAPVTVWTRGGDRLVAAFRGGPLLEGPGEKVYAGEIIR